LGLQEIKKLQEIPIPRFNLLNYCIWNAFSLNKGISGKRLISFIPGFHNSRFHSKTKLYVPTKTLVMSAGENICAIFSQLESIQQK